MPTARPSITASVIEVSVRSVKPLASVMPRAPNATPRTPVSSGRPAASSDPKVTVSTTSATTTPRTSPIGFSDSTGAATPPYSTRMPACVGPLRRRRDGVGLRGGHGPRRDREREVCVGDLAVLGDRPCRVRVGGGGDVRDLAQRFDRLLDGGLALGGVQRLPGGCREDDLAGCGIGVGAGNPFRDELGGLLGLGAGDR